MSKNPNLGERVAKLEARNQRVEADKAWETSWARRLSIMALTYVIVVFYLHFVAHIEPWINALVPVIGYSLSTITIARFKQFWIEKQQRTNQS